MPPGGLRQQPELHGAQQQMRHLPVGVERLVGAVAAARRMVQYMSTSGPLKAFSCPCLLRCHRQQRGPSRARQTILREAGSTLRQLRNYSLHQRTCGVLFEYNPHRIPDRPPTACVYSITCASAPREIHPSGPSSYPSIKVCSTPFHPQLQKMLTRPSRHVPLWVVSSRSATDGKVDLR